jgi:hypothetical protein
MTSWQLLFNKNLFWSYFPLFASSFSSRQFFSKPRNELPLVAIVRQEKTLSKFQKLSASIGAN